MKPRGTTGTYQRWADLVKDPSYTFENTLPYFKKSIRFTPPNYAKRAPGSTVHYDPSAFGNGGPLEVSYFNYWMPFSPYVKKALQALGMSEIAGANSGELIGFTEITASLDPKAEVRSSSQTSFLQKAMAETTIQVYQSTLANKILFDGDRRATAVEMTTAGSIYTLSARQEVILSAGVVSKVQSNKPRSSPDSNVVQIASATHGVRSRTSGSPSTAEHPRCRRPSRCWAEYHCTTLFSTICVFRL